MVKLEKILEVKEQREKQLNSKPGEIGDSAIEGLSLTVGAGLSIAIGGVLMQNNYTSYGLILLATGAVFAHSSYKAYRRSFYEIPREQENLEKKYKRLSKAFIDKRDSSRYPIKSQ